MNEIIKNMNKANYFTSFPHVKEFIDFKVKTLQMAAKGEITSTQANILIQPALTKAIKDSGLKKSEFLKLVNKK